MTQSYLYFDLPENLGPLVLMTEDLQRRKFGPVSPKELTAIRIPRKYADRIQEDSVQLCQFKRQDGTVFNEEWCRILFEMP